MPRMSSSRALVVLRGLEPHRGPAAEGDGDAERGVWWTRAGRKAGCLGRGKHAVLYPVSAREHVLALEDAEDGDVVLHLLQQVGLELGCDEEELRLVLLAVVLDDIVKDPLLVVDVHTLVDLVHHPEGALRHLLEGDEEQHDGHAPLPPRVQLAVELVHLAPPDVGVPEHDEDLERVVDEVVLLPNLCLLELHLPRVAHLLEHLRECLVNRLDNLPQPGLPLVAVQPLGLDRLHLLPVDVHDVCPVPDLLLQLLDLRPALLELPQPVVRNPETPNVLANEGNLLLKLLNLIGEAPKDLLLLLSQCIALARGLVEVTLENFSCPQQPLGLLLGLLELCPELRALLADPLHVREHRHHLELAHQALLARTEALLGKHHDLRDVAHPLIDDVIPLLGQNRPVLGVVLILLLLEHLLSELELGLDGRRPLPLLLELLNPLHAPRLLLVQLLLLDLDLLLLLVGNVEPLLGILEPPLKLILILSARRRDAGLVGIIEALLRRIPALLPVEACASSCCRYPF
mmetsp:Transcript_22531/g.54871  ORF Transcript_22531/g.54871 Transcript_22531/m.54871 type:complete len:516 (+) Transcript_22531:2578-4125(+)